jgi:4-hydroxybenzoate polyprenyltransferase
MKGNRMGNENRSTWRAYLELIRLPNLPTAMADVAMGFLVVRVVSGPRDGLLLGILLAASTLLYTAGVVLNDVFDIHVDARQRPERPLPSGRVSLLAACRLGAVLLVLGVALAVMAASLESLLRPALVAVLLAGCILLYDAYLKRTFLGPLAMGGCRMLNVLLGMSATAVAWRTEHWLVAAGLGTYIVGVTWFARTEAQRSNRGQLGLAMVVIVLGLGMLAAFPRWAEYLTPEFRPDRWPILMVVVGLLIGWRGWWAMADPGPARVQVVVKQCILSLVILDAAICYAVRGLGWSMIILLLLVPAVLLARWLPST